MNRPRKENDLKVPTEYFERAVLVVPPNRLWDTIMGAGGDELPFLK